MNTDALHSIFKGISKRPTQVMRRLGRIWLDEFFELLPGNAAEWLVGHARSRLALAVIDQEVVLELRVGGRETVIGRMPIQECCDAALTQYLKSHGLVRKDVDVGVRLKSEQVYRRMFFLPSEAVGSVERIVAGELATRTPFRADDICHGYAVVPTERSDRRAVWQWVVRRSFVEAAAATIRFDSRDLDFIDADEEEAAGGPSPYIPLRTSSPASARRIGISIAALGCTATVLLATWCSLVYWRQASVMRELDARLAVAKVKAQQVRSQLDQYEERRSILSALRSARSAPGLMDVLEETARVLPAHTWVTELRYSAALGNDAKNVAATGLSAAAPGLVGTLNGSPMFFEAALTAPVSVDAMEGRERFVLNAKVRSNGRVIEGGR